MGEEKRMDTFESLARNHVELQVKPCASGVLCSALMYNADGSIVILAKEGLALGYFDYPMGTGEWKLHSKLEHWDDWGEKFILECPSCGRKVFHVDYRDAPEDLLRKYPFCHCGMKMIGISEVIE